jgi:hypothetical protein
LLHLSIRIDFSLTHGDIPDFESLFRQISWNSFAARASQVFKEAFNLSDGEEKFIVNAKIGQGTLVTQEGCILFYDFLSDEERRLFTTKPKEVTA